MGGSFSDERKSMRSKSSFNSYVKTIKNFKFSQAERLERLKKWRHVLTELIAAQDSQETELWTILKTYVSSIPDHMTIEWIANAQCSSLSASTYNSQFSARRERTVLDLDKINVEKAEPKKSLAGKQWPTVSARTTQISDSHMSTLTLSSKILNSQIFYEFQSRFSAKQALRKNLVNQINRSNHIVLVLIKGFCSASNSMFKQYQDISLEEYTSYHEQAYNRIVTAIKEFINVVESFVGWIYEDLIKQLEEGLDHEDVNAAYVIQSVIYSILFKTLSPQLVNLIYKLINLKYKDDITRFKDVLQTKHKESLESYDEVLQSAKDFLLKSSSEPYEQVYNKIKKIISKTNPYSKFDIITSLDEEMWNCVCAIHKDDTKLAKLRGAFGTELRFPVLIYCVVQSQCEELLAEVKFIEEFMPQNSIDSSIGYTSLASSLNYLLMKMEAESSGLEH